MEPATKRFKKRDAIYTCLCQTDTHPSAEMVHQMLQPEHSDISLATVYRNLTYFKNQGMIASVATVRGVERFDANTEPHVHFICNGCDAVTDLMQIHVPEELNQQVTKATGGTVSMCHLTFHGYCDQCKAKQEGVIA